MNENKNKNQEQNSESLNGAASMKETVNNLVDEKVAELKAKLFMEVPEDAGFTTDQTLVVRDIILKAVNQAVEIGRVYPSLDENYFKDAAENLNKMWEKLTDPAANVKAESISKLYHLQRYIISNLLGVIQSQHTIAGVIEAEGTPYQTPMNIVSSLFAPNAFSSAGQMLEKQPLS